MTREVPALSGKTVIEINGVKMVVDLSTARTVTEYRIGDCIKILKKKYSDEWVSYPGMIVGFDAFANLPSILIAYLENDYSTADIKFICFNARSEAVEIAPANDIELQLTKESVLEKMDAQIQECRRKIEEVENKKQVFLKTFSEKFKFLGCEQ